jgi:hypothetical protein
MVFINSTDFFGVVLNGLTVNITGSTDLTLFMVLFLLLVFALTFSIPAEYVAPVMFPLLLVCLAFTSSVAVIVGFAILIIVLSVLRMWFI